MTAGRFGTLASAADCGSQIRAWTASALAEAVPLPRLNPWGAFSRKSFTSSGTSRASRPSASDNCFQPCLSSRICLPIEQGAFGGAAGGFEHEFAHGLALRVRRSANQGVLLASGPKIDSVVLAGSHRVTPEAASSAECACRQGRTPHHEEMGRENAGAQSTILALRRETGTLARW